LVDSNLEQEEAPGCAGCGTNRRMLERAWQTVANEYYDPRGAFSQAKWAKELLLALQVSPGSYLGTWEMSRNNNRQSLCDRRC
jgi:hypothetical protein